MPATPATGMRSFLRFVKHVAKAHPRVKLHIVAVNYANHKEDSDTGTPQGGILSPLLANIALSVLDEHLMTPWRPGGVMDRASRRHSRRAHGLPTWRIVRYADDFVVLVHG